MSDANDDYSSKIELNDLLDTFYMDKDILEHNKKRVETENKRIKELMSELNATEYENNRGVVAKITVQNRESFQEDRLIAKLKQLGIISPIKTVEVIDYDDLEDVIYNGMLDASILAEFKNVKQVITLKVDKKGV